MRINSLLFVLILMVATVEGQENLIEFDKFDVISCEDLSVRLDVLMSELNKRPDTTAAIVLRQSDNKSKWYRKVIPGLWEHRGYPRDRLQFLSVAGQATIATISLLPAGIPSANAERRPWVQEPLDLSRAFVYGYEDDTEICATFSAELYADILKAPPELRGNIVVHGETRRIARDAASDWIRQFIEKWGITRKQLRVFIRVSRVLDSWDAEFWLVPSRK